MSATYRVLEPAFCGHGPEVCMRGPGTNHETVTYPQPLKEVPRYLELITNPVQARALSTKEKQNQAKQAAATASGKKQAAAISNQVYQDPAITPDAPPPPAPAVVETL